MVENDLITHNNLILKYNNTAKKWGYRKRIYLTQQSVIYDFFLNMWRYTRGLDS